MNKESATRLINSVDGKAFAEYLSKKVLELDSCRTILTNPTEIAVEMKAREKAVSVLVEILNDLLVGREQEFESFDRKEYAIEI